MADDLYRDRRLSAGYPDLERLGVGWFKEHQPTETRVAELMPCLERLIDLSAGLKTIAVVGCGPKPVAVRQLRERGYEAVGIEPVAGSVEAAAEFLGDRAAIRQAGAESMPFKDETQRVVILDSVLEHVDSPASALAEAYRVLAPGGVLFVYTTNKLKVRLNGENGEFRTPYFNWFPAIVRESYVYRHLHYEPSLANYSPRPAVHWFTFAELCRVGREAGFAQFYSMLDLVDQESPALKRGRMRSALVSLARTSPWLRALALTQFGSSIFMLKRVD